MLISEGTAFLAEETANLRAWRLGEALHVEGTAEARVAEAEWGMGVGAAGGEIRGVTEMHVL